MHVYQTEPGQGRAICIKSRLWTLQFLEVLHMPADLYTYKVLERKSLSASIKCCDDKSPLADELRTISIDALLIWDIFLCIILGLDAVLGFFNTWLS